MSILLISKGERAKLNSVSGVKYYFFSLYGIMYRVLQLSKLYIYIALFLILYVKGYFVSSQN